MPIIRAQVTLPHDNGLPEDASTNTFHFRVPAPVTPVATASIALRLLGFYDNASTAGGGRLSEWMSTLINLAGARLRMYNLDDVMPRAPVYDQPMTFIGSTASTTLPSEVALVLTFQGLKVSGLPQARRRGRIYFGPLSDGAADQNTGRPRPLLLDALTNRAAALAEGNNDPGDIQWVVRSTVAQSVVDVADGWVDDAFDTQRRRGPAATFRQLWT